MVVWYSNGQKDGRSVAIVFRIQLCKLLFLHVQYYMCSTLNGRKTGVVGLVVGNCGCGCGPGCGYVRV